MSYCKNCYYPVDTGHKFCSHCGVRLEEVKPLEVFKDRRSGLSPGYIAGRRESDRINSLYGENRAHSGENGSVRDLYYDGTANGSSKAVSHYAEKAFADSWVNKIRGEIASSETNEYAAVSTLTDTGESSFAGGADFGGLKTDKHFDLGGDENYDGSESDFVPQLLSMSETDRLISGITGDSYDCSEFDYESSDIEPMPASYDGGSFGRTEVKALYDSYVDTDDEAFEGLAEQDSFDVGEFESGFKSEFPDKGCVTYDGQNPEYSAGGYKPDISSETTYRGYHYDEFDKILEKIPKLKIYSGDNAGSFEPITDYLGAYDFKNEDSYCETQSSATDSFLENIASSYGFEEASEPEDDVLKSLIESYKTPEAQPAATDEKILRDTPEEIDAAPTEGTIQDMVKEKAMEEKAEIKNETGVRTFLQMIVLTISLIPTAGIILGLVLRTKGRTEVTRAFGHSVFLLGTIVLTVSLLAAMFFIIM